VSHQPERKDKNCLNCGTEVQGRFCHVCGQENIIPHQNFWSLTKHFIYDIFHFDGKFFDTVKYLFIKPGYVAKEYVKGKRMSFLDPIRMYLFTSAIFFLIFFKFMNPVPRLNLKEGKRDLSNVERIHVIDSIQAKLGNSRQDSIKRAQLEILKDTTTPLLLSDVALLTQSNITIGDNKFHTLEEYEAHQKKLAENKRDGWFKRALVKRSLQINQKYEGDQSALLKEFIDSFLHRLPILLFVSLPFFALILKMLYSRRKNFFYSDHAVFTLYQYIFGFILLLFLFSFSRLEDATGWEIFSWLFGIGFIYGGYYLLRSLKLFYNQTWGKTTVKFLLLNFIGGIVIVLLFIVFFLLSIFEL
jgi:hypothetical protein